ncbi:hypothetical protein Cri9333_4771 (plasmid) [Crinalium epipsammum PCC 9333]|uniref:HNH nuclease domain-containing protein n=1 Tax=Crinalium epipsammum PCC 9333 TaxID=1173022 RepID=K9W7Y0_9CYAN|nr:HNH endonuclease [Crinalium epipsammum]AFZ15545.1 hypothetical protein Cri9333_4771 [Crinalium epipsammum PCC 9333]
MDTVSLTISFYDLEQEEQFYLLRRFLAPGIVEINSKTGCHELQKYLDVKGYGRLQAWHDGTKKSLKLHRLAFEFFNETKIPSNLAILHNCDNRKCVNPAHLSTGTLAENIKDCVAKGRNSKGSRNGNNKLNEAQVTAIKRLLDGGMSRVKIAKLYGVYDTTIGNIARGRTWRHVA